MVMGKTTLWTSSWRETSDPPAGEHDGVQEIAEDEPEEPR